MPRRDEQVELDPVVVLIPDEPGQSMDEWLASLTRDEPIELAVSAADLVREVRSEHE